jgi:hypothetical protein
MPAGPELRLGQRASILTEQVAHQWTTLPRHLIERARTAKRAEVIAALVLWFLLVLAPGLATALRPAGDGVASAAVPLSRLFGSDVAGYLGFAPVPLILRTVGQLATSPLALLLLVVALPKRPERTDAASRTLVAFATWFILCEFAAVLIVAALAARGSPVAPLDLMAWVGR